MTATSPRHATNSLHVATPRHATPPHPIETPPVAAPEPLARLSDVEQYRAAFERYRRGDWDDERWTAFRLRFGIYGQRQPGVQMARIKIPGGVLPIHWARAIARANRVHAKGDLHLTTRQDVQLYSVPLAATPALLEDLHAAGLTTREACGNTLRNISACALAGACPRPGGNALTRISEIGDPPKLTSIENPAKEPGYKPITMPMPAPVIATRQPSSLWRAGARAFFKDQRASDVGDLVTVIIQIDDQAKINNTTKRSRKNTENANASTFLGFESKLKDILPEAVDPTNLVDAGSTLSNEGAGSVDRNEKITLRIAAVITQVLPNGNMVVQGRQEIRVNFEEIGRAHV